MSCKEAMAELLGAIEHGGALSGEQREHIKHCARCRELLDSAASFDSEESAPIAPPPVDEQRLGREVHGVRLRELFRRAGLAALISVAFFGAIGLFVFRRKGIEWQEAAIILSVAAVFAIIALVVLYALLAALRDRNGNRIYKRLGPGRQLSGVCLGIAEATGVSPALLRIGFIVLAFVDGIGIWLYLLFDLAMPVHPADREHLLRFKLRRAWQRRFAHADNDPR